MGLSKITPDFRTTVPADVRAAFGVGVGDTLAWEVVDAAAIVRMMPRSLKGYDAFARLSFSEEWLSPEDEEAFRDL